MQYQRPHEYQWKDEKLERSVTAFWRVPVALVKKDDGSPGVWPSLLREWRAARGGGLATSLLPVLARHWYPTHPADWRSLPARHMAALAGIDKSAVRPALDLLAEYKLVETGEGPRGRDGGKPLLQYRLRGVHGGAGGRDPNEAYAYFPAWLIHSGIWSQIETNAARHVYTAVACLDPVLNDETFPLPPDEKDRSSRLAAVRAEKALGLRELGEFTGLGETQLRAALRELTATRFNTAGYPTRGRSEGHALLRTGPAANNRLWYAPDPAVVAAKCRYPVDYLNAPDGWRYHERLGLLMPPGAPNEARRAA